MINESAEEIPRKKNQHSKHKTIQYLSLIGMTPFFVHLISVPSSS